MILYFRALKLTASLLLKKSKLDPHQKLKVSFRVLPTDLDVNMHLNNSRYLAFVDLVRVRFMVPSGIYKQAKAMGAISVIGSTYLRFRRSLAPFEKFTVVMEIAYMSPQWAYVDYKFVKHGFVYCHVIEKWGFSVPGSGMLEMAKLFPPKPGVEDFPEPPAHIVKIMAAEEEMRTSVRQDS